MNLIKNIFNAKYLNLKKLNIFLFFGIAFFIPLLKTFQIQFFDNTYIIRSMGFIIILFTISGIITGDYSVLKKKNVWIKLTKVLLWLIPFFHLLFLNSVETYWNKLEVKLSLIFIPIIVLIAVDFKKEIFNTFLKVFIFGGIVAVIICLIISIYNFYFLDNIMAFTYQNLSYFHHPSYFAMYLNFIVGILYYHSINPIKSFNINRPLTYILILLLTFFIILLSSRTGWISNILITILFVIFSIKRKSFNKIHFGFILTIILSSVIIFKTVPSVKSRSNSLINYISHNIFETDKKTSFFSSSVTRIIAWKCSLELISEKIIFGYGEGLSGVELNKLYKNKDYKQLENKNLNSHNQFLQCFIDNGLIGGCTIIFFTIIMLFKSLKTKDYLYSLFLILITINFLTESMLETQSGVVFFAVFNTLFFFQWVDKNIS
jgi:O-antigen ligase